MNDQYATPDWIKNIFSEWYDPCPLNPTPIQDGLKFDWTNNSFVNPPYSDPLPWVEKAIEENKKGIKVVMLLKFDCTTKWYKLLVSHGAHFMHITERVKFNGKTPPFCNMLVILEGKK